MTMRHLVCLLLLVPTLARAETVTITGPASVDDAALLDGEFAGWNFGASPLLEAGLMGGIYAEHRGASMIRFDVRPLAGAKVTGAMLRLYKPKDFVQTAPVDVAIHAIRVPSDWQEGEGFAEPKGNAVTQATNIGYDGNPIASAVAPDDRGGWIEFALPAELAQKWIDDPASNAGVYVAVAKPATAWGEHAYFHASEHWSGNGPQLVIECTPVPPLAASRATTRPTLFRLPAESSLKPWLDKNGRLAKFTKDGAMSLSQARLFQFYDTTVREQLIKARYQIPLVKVMNELGPLIKRGGNDDAIREMLRRVRELLLVWEYIRETCWYTSGPLADDLSPKQVGILFGRSIFGRMEEAGREKGEPIWQPVPPEELDRHVETMLRNTREKLKMTPEQFKPLEAALADAERKENEYLIKFRADFDACRAMLDSGEVDETKMFDLVRGMHLNHELFLYYQSIYDTPRWSVLMKHAPPAALAAWVVDARRGHYERQTGMSIGDKEEE
jgi:hypothetical protein